MANGTLRRDKKANRLLALLLGCALGAAQLGPSPAMAGVSSDVFRQPGQASAAGTSNPFRRAGSLLGARASGSSDLMLDHAEMIAGGYNGNGIIAIRTDAAGDVYVIGNGSDPNFVPPAPGYGTGDVYDNCNFGCSYIIKYDPSLKPVYTDILPDSHAYGAAVDSAGEVYLTGETGGGPSFPVTAGAWDTTNAGGFVTKFNAAGTGLVYSTYVDHVVETDSIAVDPGGDCYFLATMAYADFPTTPDAMEPADPGGNQAGVVGELSPDGSALLYGSFIGGSGTDTANRLYFDTGQSSLYIVGTTTSTDFPVTRGNYHGGSSDGFVVKLDAASKAVDYAEYIGGSEGDGLLAVTGANDGTSDIYVGGVSASTDFPVTSGAYQTALGGRASAVVVRLTPNGDIQSATYLGGPGYSAGFTQIDALSADPQGDVYASGFTSVFQPPASADAVQDFNVSMFQDAGSPAIGFITEFDPTQSNTLFSTLYGGEYAFVPELNSPFSSVVALYLDQSGDLYAAGFTDTLNPPLTIYDPNAEVLNNGPADNGFWLRFSSSPLTITTPTLLPLAIVGEPYSVNFQVSGGTPPYTWAPVSESVPSSMTLTPDGMLSGNVTNDEYSAIPEEDRLFALRVTDSAGHSAVKGFDILFDYPRTVSGPSLITEPPGMSFRVQYSILGGGGFCALGTGSLPGGVSVTNDPTWGCVVEGSASKTGTYTFSIKAGDNKGQVVYSPDITLDIAEPKSASSGNSGGGGGTVPSTLALLSGMLIFLAFRRRTADGRRRVPRK